MNGARREWGIFGALVAGFALLWVLPVESARFQGALVEAFRLTRWYAREHVLLCLVPAFFIAGAIGVFVSQGAVMRYFGPKAHKGLAYGVASVSGTILAVCSCTVLPIFGGIYARGAGLGPAIAFLYSGPAINVLAIVLTARVLGWELGLARALGAVTFSVAIGLLMHALFRREERAKAEQAQGFAGGADAAPTRALWKTAALFAGMVAVLVFANWARSGDVRAVFLCCPNGLSVYTVEGQLLERTADEVRVLEEGGAVRVIPAAEVRQVTAAHPEHWANRVHAARWGLVVGLLAALAWMVGRWVGAAERREWLATTWSFAKQITPLLLGGVLAAGFLLGSPEVKDGGVVPNRWVQALVGEDPGVFWGLVAGSGAAAPGWLRAVWPLWVNLFAAAAGALMYFATLTEVPIVRGLLDSGMGQGPALALLLAGPALSLPSMLVINSILGPRKSLAYVGLVVAMATVTGLAYGWVAGG
jgi:uncharacterized membrane protein YraQ (UPF0718 family)